MTLVILTPRTTPPRKKKVSINLMNEYGISSLKKKKMCIITAEGIPKAKKKNQDILKEAALSFRREKQESLFLIYVPVLKRLCPLRHKSDCSIQARTHDFSQYDFVGERLDL